MGDIHTIDPDSRSDDSEKGTMSGLSRRLMQPAVLAGLILASLVFFSTTSPRSVPSVLLIAGFVALGIMLYAILKLVMVISGLYARIRPVWRRGILLTGTVLPILLLMMQSVGQLTLRDVVTLGGLFLIGVFYTARAGRWLRS